MDFIPITPDDNVRDFLDDLCSFPFSFVGIENPGDYENECIVFKANENIESLYDYILTYIVEDMETGLPDYAQSRFLTFDSIELEKGSILRIYTRKGDDGKAIDFDTCALQEILYWGLPEAIWDKPHTSYELITRRDSMSGGL